MATTDVQRCAVNLLGSAQTAGDGLFFQNQDLAACMACCHERMCHCQPTRTSAKNYEFSLLTHLRLPFLNFFA
jgi:hypothetical protein